MLSADLQSEQVAINKDSKCCIHMGLKQILLNISIVSQTNYVWKSPLEFQNWPSVLWFVNLFCLYFFFFKLSAFLEPSFTKLCKRHEMPAQLSVIHLACLHSKLMKKVALTQNLLKNVTCRAVEWKRQCLVFFSPSKHLNFRTVSNGNAKEMRCDQARPVQLVTLCGKIFLLLV